LRFGELILWRLNGGYKILKNYLYFMILRVLRGFIYFGFIKWRALLNPGILRLDY